METEQKIRIHQLVEYIKQDPEFPFDTHDELDEILEYYEITTPADPELSKAIESEIAAIAEAAQSSEITRVALAEVDRVV